MTPSIRRYQAAARAYWRLRLREFGRPVKRASEEAVSGRAVSTPMGEETRQAAHAALRAYAALSEHEREWVREAAAAEAAGEVASA